MARVEIGHHLAIDTRVCGGRLIFKGTRILVNDALQMIRSGLTPRKVAQEYPGLLTPAAASEAVSLMRVRRSHRGRKALLRVLIFTVRKCGQYNGWVRSTPRLASEKYCYV